MTCWNCGARYNPNDTGSIAVANEQREINIWNEPDEAHCDCVSDHNPNPVSFDRHHILPLSWGGEDVESNVIVLCPTAHRNVHDLLRHYRKLDGAVPWEVRKHYSVFIRELAEQGWRLYFAGTDINLSWQGNVEWEEPKVWKISD